LPLSDIVENARKELSRDALNLMWIFAAPERKAPLATIDKSTDRFTLRKKAGARDFDTDVALGELDRKGYVRLAKQNEDAVYLSTKGYALMAHIKNDEETRESLFGDKTEPPTVSPENIVLEYEGASLAVFDLFDEETGQYAVKLLYKCKNRECNWMITLDYVWEEATMWTELKFECPNCGYEYRMYRAKIW